MPISRDRLATANATTVAFIPEYGVRARRGDVEPLLSEDLFYRVQAVLSGRVPAQPRSVARPPARSRRS
jgi:hypothetical protein